MSLGKNSRENILFLIISVPSSSEPDSSPSSPELSDEASVSDAQEFHPGIG